MVMILFEVFQNNNSLAKKQSLAEVLIQLRITFDTEMNIAITIIKFNRYSGDYIIITLQIWKITVLTNKLTIHLFWIHYRVTSYTYTNAKSQEQTRQEYYNN